MVKTYFKCVEKYPYTQYYSALPAHFCQLFIVDVAQEYNLDLDNVLRAVFNQLGSSMTFGNFVGNLINPLIIQNFEFLIVDNNLQLAKNRESFQKLISYMNRVIVNKIPQFESYYVVSSFVQQYPTIATLIQDQFKNFYSSYPIIFLDYLAILNNMPKPKYDKNYLKHLIFTYEFD